MDKHKNKNTKRHGKVINTFTVEFLPFGSDPSLYSNSCNPYSHLSDEERLRDLIDIFSILWAESCREKINKDDA